MSNTNQKSEKSTKQGIHNANYCYAKFGKYLKEQIKKNKRIPLTTEEIESLCSDNFKIKIITCNICEHEFYTKIKDDSRIRCEKCNSNESLSILSYIE